MVEQLAVRGLEAREARVHPRRIDRIGGLVGHEPCKQGLGVRVDDAVPEVVAFRVRERELRSLRKTLRRCRELGIPHRDRRVVQTALIRATTVMSLGRAMELIERADELVLRLEATPDAPTLEAGPVDAAREALQ